MVALHDSQTAPRRRRLPAWPIAVLVPAAVWGAHRLAGVYVAIGVGLAWRLANARHERRELSPLGRVVLDATCTAVAALAVVLALVTHAAVAVGAASALLALAVYALLDRYRA